MSRAITESEFKEWLDHPVTKEIRRVLAGKRADLRNEWEQSEPTSYMKETFVAGNIANIGMCRGLLFAEAIDYETYVTELDDGKHIGVKTSGSSGAN
jgi:hypothetical protein